MSLSADNAFVARPDYDVIVVGGRIAGATLAAPRSDCRYRNQRTRTATITRWETVARSNPERDWVDQQHCGIRHRLLCPRGRTKRQCNAQLVHAFLLHVLLNNGTHANHTICNVVHPHFRWDAMFPSVCRISA
jgi:hypothetical protein